MGSFSADALLRLPVRLQGIRLAQPVDLLLDPGGRRALGFVVLCGDESLRFLPFAAVQPAEDEIAVGSALMLLEDVDFYSARADSLRALRGGAVLRNGRPTGVLRDLLLAPDGTVAEIVVERDGHEESLGPEGTILSSERAAA